MTDDFMAEQQKQRGRPFAKGQSGNPRGRPRRSGNSTTQAMQSLLDAEAGALANKVLELALGGDKAALRMCLDRLLPTPRERTVPLAMPRVRGVRDLTPAMAAIMNATARGHIAAREGAGLARLVDVFLKALDTHDFDRRLRRLEQAKATRP
jgi:Family of unknown function (DUF5681)